MIISYYPHSKNTQNKKNKKFEICKNSKCFRISNFQKPFTTCKWGCNVHDIYKKVVAYDIKLKPK